MCDRGASYTSAGMPPIRSFFFFLLRAKLEPKFAHVGQIDQIDHDLDHLGPDLPV